MAYFVNAGKLALSHYLHRQLGPPTATFRLTGAARPTSLLFLAGFLLMWLGAVAQQSTTPPATSSAPADNLSTVLGCLRGQRGNYVLIDEKSNLPYVLKGVGNKLNGQLNRQVEVKG